MEEVAVLDIKPGQVLDKPLTLDGKSIIIAEGMALDDNDFDKQMVNENFIYGGDDIGEEDAHRWGYSARTIGGYLKEVGFDNIEKGIPNEFHRNQAACFRVRATK